MRRFFLISSFLTLFAIGSSAQWKPAGDKIKTDWASQINPANVLPEYPRPIMERSDWKNLNGLWNYAVINKGEHLPAEFEGQILVPFAIESSLSGVGKRINENQELVYQRSFEIPSAWKGKQVLLHFGAVDWKTDVWVNDVKVGSHTGGFTPFSFDITAALSGKGNNQLVVKVWDPTDKGPQPRGKQVSNPEGIWYTPVSGIWQTVWMEPVAGKHIENLRITPDIDRNLLTVKAELNSACPSDFVEVNVYDGNQLVATGKSINAEPVEVSMPRNAKLWSPDSPFLYTLKVTLKSGGKVVDKVDSYAAMRKYSTRRDADGIVRLELNNEALFQFGPLDQGWWPDGLYTAPSDEALAFDVVKTKELGYNMIRKHAKMVGFEDCRAHYKHPEKVVVTGTPVRGDFFTVTKQQAKEKLGMNDGRKLIVSFWGSLGSNAMNRAMAEFLALESAKEPFYHIHGVGEICWKPMQQWMHDDGLEITEHPALDVREYIYDMATVMRAADLVICRAGASTLSELTALGVPAILVPSPNVTNHHQEKNAALLGDHGAALVLPEEGLDGKKLFAAAAGILNDPQRMETMSQNMAALGIPDATKRIYDTVMTLLK